MKVSSVSARDQQKHVQSRCCSLTGHMWSRSEKQETVTKDIKEEG